MFLIITISIQVEQYIHSSNQYWAIRVFTSTSSIYIRITERLVYANWKRYGFNWHCSSWSRSRKCKVSFIGWRSGLKENIFEIVSWKEKELKQFIWIDSTLWVKLIHTERNGGVLRKHILKECKDWMDKYIYIGWRW
jgi:hypothetical protein